MKKLLFLTFLPFILFTATKAQTTQHEADDLVLERMSAETRLYSIYVKQGVQPTGTEITTSAGEIIELDYESWVYYVLYVDISQSKYLIVKKENGNLLEINLKNNETPEDLEEWKMVIGALQGTKWKLVGIIDTQTGIIRELEPLDCEGCYTLEFYPEIPIGRLLTFIIDPDNTVIEEEGQLVNIDEDLNNAFEYYNVFSYKWAFPLAFSEWLRQFAYIDCYCNILGLGEFLTENYSGHFSDIEYYPGFPYPYSYEVIGVGALYKGKYEANYILSTFKFTSIAVSAPEYTIDGSLYLTSLYKVKEMELKDTELKLFFDDKNYYLLFNKIQ